MEQLRSLSDLLDLHDIDLAIDHLLDERNSLPELEDYRRVHGEVDRLDAELAQARAELKQADLSLDKTNGELEIAAEKAAAEQNRLYAGGLSARDADYLRREVEMLFGRVKKLEDDVLTYMEEKEGAEERVVGLEEARAVTDADKQRLSGIIRDRWATIDAQIAREEERKSTAIGLVDEDLLETYDELRERRSGRVVGRLVDGVCGACHLQLSAAEVARTSKEHPPRCIHCRAILVV